MPLPCSTVASPIASNAHRKFSAKSSPSRTRTPTAALTEYGRGLPKNHSKKCHHPTGTGRTFVAHSFSRSLTTTCTASPTTCSRFSKIPSFTPLTPSSAEMSAQAIPTSPSWAHTSRSPPAKSSATQNWPATEKNASKYFTNTPSGRAHSASITAPLIRSSRSTNSPECSATSRTPPRNDSCASLTVSPGSISPAASTPRPASGQARTAAVTRHSCATALRPSFKEQPATK